MRHCFKPAVLAAAPYRKPDSPAAIKLDQNESPFDLPDELKRSVLKRIEAQPWHRYPEPGAALLARLARYAGVTPENLLVGNGSNDLLQTVALAALEPGARTLTVVPTFALYRTLLGVAGAAPKEVAYAPDWSFPEARVLQALAAHQPRLCVFASPNNPTGTQLLLPTLQRILRAAPGLVLVDEAYADFAPETAVRLLSAHPNLLITRTFSKAWGLAGVRFGYLMAAPGLIAQLRKVQLPYNVSAFTLAVVEAALQQPEYLARTVAMVERERGRLRATLMTLPGVAVAPSAANFLLVETPRPAKELCAQLRSRGVSVRDVSGLHARLSHAIRVTVGRPEENSAFLAALQEVLTMGNGNKR